MDVQGHGIDGESRHLPLAGPLQPRFLRAQGFRQYNRTSSSVSFRFLAVASSSGSLSASPDAS